MRVVIIEDEIPAATRLARMLQSADGSIEIVKSLDSVESSVKYLQAAADIDLIFMDIQLADGLSFTIFQQIKLNTPVIFTTAFDQYTLKAFKVNSLDYLLKPIDEHELKQAVEKYRQLYPRTDKHMNRPAAEGLSEKIEKLVQEMTATKYKERLLIKRGQQLHYLKTGATAYYYADGKLCYAIDFKGSSYMLDNNLNQLEELLTPTQFFRVNRQLLVNIESIKKIHTWLGGRLKLELAPPTDADTIVSRERVNGFKEWLGQ
ncbi:MAG TPA: LytTR family DNA-binding domain-containing protein [Puia sp.]|nr:LytTR family DNA-binding domain-containing protein [Puia sp.]